MDEGLTIMRLIILHSYKTFRYKKSMKKCGAISCINNVQGNCNLKKCDLYENVLIQED